MRNRKWQIVDRSTHTLSFLNQAAELNLVTVTMTEGSEENAQMQESQENNSKPPAWRLFYLYLQLTLIYHSIHCIYSVLIGVFMSNELDSLSEVVKGLTKIELPSGGGGETDSPVVEAAIAVGIVGAAAYGIYKLFGRAEPQKDEDKPGF